jgi:hypothetical protein
MTTVLSKTFPSSPSKSKIEGVSLADLIPHSNFPRLLNFQYLMAATQIYTNPELSMSLLNYVCLATQSKAGSMLNAQAQSLRISLAAKLSGTAIASVPSLNIYSCKQILKSRLLAAQSFEETFLKCLASERNSVNWSYLGLDLLRKSENALEEYSFLSALSNKRYDEALEAHKYADIQFQKTRKLVDEASATFKSSVEKWEKEQKIQAAKDILFAVVGVGIAIAATVATAGGKDFNTINFSKRKQC